MIYTPQSDGVTGFTVPLLDDSPLYSAPRLSNFDLPCLANGDSPIAPRDGEDDAIDHGLTSHFHRSDNDMYDHMNNSVYYFL